MGRRPRGDLPGSWHHVVNRGIAKRPLFETRKDARYFLYCVARQVQAGRIEVHAYCLMLTHFHMLVYSPIGELSEAMRLLQNDYSRYFNRKHKRDGPLIRGRFFSKPVHSKKYRRTLVRYIDANPVKARLVKSSWEYEFGSASHYMLGSGPIWLTRDWVEADAVLQMGYGAFSTRSYESAFGKMTKAQMVYLEEIVETRTALVAACDPLEDLVGSTPLDVQAWLRRKTKLADGHRVGLPVCSRLAVEEALKTDVQKRGEWVVPDGRKTRSGAELARAGLLRELCGMTWAEVARADKGASRRSQRLGEHHKRLLTQNPEYAARVAEVACEALARCRML